MKQLHIGEHFFFYSDGIISPLLTPANGLPELKRTLTELQRIFETEDNLFKISQASIFSKEIFVSNAKRVGYFNFFWHCIDIAEYEGTPAINKAVETMNFLHHTYKDLPSYNYLVLSSAMISFFQDCATPRFQAPIQTLSAALDINLASIIGKMKAAHDKFVSLHEQRALSKEHIAAMGKLSKVRFEVDSTLAFLVDGINVSWNANELGAGDPSLRQKLTEVREIINSAVHQAKNSLAHRGKRKYKKKPKPAKA